MSSIVEVSKTDREYLALIRSNIEGFMSRSAERYAHDAGYLLDIAPQDHAGAAGSFPGHIKVETLDIDPAAKCTYVADICRHNPQIEGGRFDFVVCTEVLEHTLQPFAATGEIWRLLKPGGLLLLSVPFNFRIHGPLPDCWRFTEHGLRVLLDKFQILTLEAIETPGRPLMPIHYTVVARKPVSTDDKDEDA